MNKFAKFSLLGVFLVSLFSSVSLPHLSIVTAATVGTVETLGNSAQIGSVFNGERITKFNSEIQIRKDGVLTVTETIDFNVTGDQIKHGIYRDFPTVSHTKNGIRSTVRFTIEEVLLNGKPEEYAIESFSEGIRARIGSKDKILAPGQYQYIIKYKTNRQILFFDTYDQFAWDINGTGWKFPIDSLHAKVTFPKNEFSKTETEGIVKSIETFTGVYGAGNTTRAIVSVLSQTATSSESVEVLSTRNLAPKENTTVRIKFKKGIVIPPTETQVWVDFIFDNGTTLFTYFNCLVVLLLYAFLWRKIGKDPKLPAVFAQYEAPQDLSPAQIAFHTRMGFESDALPALILNMAVKGYLKIEKPEKKYLLTILDRSKEHVLSAEELIVAQELFGDKESVELSREKARADMAQVELKVQSLLKKIFIPKYFKLHRGYWYFVFIVSILLLIPALILDQGNQLLLVIFLSTWVTVMVRNLTIALPLARSKSSTVPKIVVVFFLTFITMFFGGVIVFMLYILAQSPSIWTPVSAILLTTIHVTFYSLLTQRTKEGVQLHSQILGFKKFLTMTEQDRMNFRNPPEKTPELFEKFLPYALALGVENQWNSQFSSVFEKMKASGHEYQPIWISGSWSSFSSGGMSGFSSSFSQAVSDTSSSSGGFSGGGGGGGGGGGW